MFRNGLDLGVELTEHRRRDSERLDVSRDEHSIGHACGKGMGRADVGAGQAAIAAGERPQGQAENDADDEHAERGRRADHDGDGDERQQVESGVDRRRQGEDELRHLLDVVSSDLVEVAETTVRTLGPRRVDECRDQAESGPAHCKFSELSDQPRCAVARDRAGEKEHGREQHGLIARE